MSTKIAIETKNVSKSFGKKVVLKDISLQVTKGSIFALLGPNGAGKTTAVRILSTLTRADGGTASVAGYDLAKEAKAIRPHISLTGQYAAVDEKLTGKENLYMIGELCGIDRSEVKQRTQQLLAQFDLSADANKISGTYSGGMRRKLDLAMSLITSPEIIFLDEPTTGLDPRSRRAMWEIINNLRSAGVTIFLTTQYLEEADQLADVIAVIDGGTVVAEGAPSELKSRVGDRSLQLVFATTKEAQAASKLFDKAATLPTSDSTVVDIKTDGSIEHTKSVMDVLAAAHVQPVDMTFHKPSLDDVFFALTGNHNQKENDNEN